jgi:hypothetical protein
MSALIYWPKKGRFARHSTQRHRRLCERRGHRPGVKSWFQKNGDGVAWERHVESWCPRCQRPVRIEFGWEALPNDIYITGAQTEDYAPQRLDAEPTP